ncbi:MAG: sulfite exporter TauE/SafE family protein, partial [Chloroflexi bacterium]|nr:sulfite exporter TauE/SafE family protein [Chloroflexota bacterium]
VLVTPLLSLVMPVASAISLSLPLLLIADPFALWFYWRTWDNRLIRLMLPAAVFGVVMGTFLLANLPDDVLRRILGVFTLVFIAYRIISDRLKTLSYRPQNWHGYLAGWASGLGSALANTGAPPFTAYLLLQEIEPRAFVGTTTLFFAIVNLLKLPGLIIADLMDFNQVLMFWWVVPIIPLAVWLGRRLIDRINQKRFEQFMLAVLFVAALVLLFVTPPDA